MKVKSVSRSVELKRLTCLFSGAAGFTLIELIVTVMIAGVLVAILYVGIAGVREMAQSTRCGANLRTIGAGIFAVAADNNGRLPALGTASYAQQPTWGMRVAGAMGIDLSVTAQKTAFWCPSDKTAETEQGLHMQRNHVGHSSYTANLTVMDWKEGNSALGGPARGGARLGEIPQAARMILLGENHHENNVISWADHGGRICHKGWTFEYTIPNGTVDTDPAKKGYHRGKNNWLFADGHVERLSFEETITPVNLWY